MHHTGEGFPRRLPIHNTRSLPRPTQSILVSVTGNHRHTTLLGVARVLPESSPLPSLVSDHGWCVQHMLRPAPQEQL